MAAAKKKSKARTALDAMFAVQTADLPDPTYRGKEKRLGVVLDITRKQDDSSELSEQDDQSKVEGLSLVADGAPLVTEGLPLVDELVADGAPLVETPVAEGLPVVADSKPVVADGLPLVSLSNFVEKATQISEQNWIPLSPLQWQGWVVLLSADTEQKVVSYKQIAGITKASSQGVRKAFGVLEKEGGILKRQTVRERTVQGLKVTIDRERPFRQVTLRDTQALIKRGSITGSRPSATSSKPSATATSGRPLRMYVCKKNTYIQEEDLAALLRLPPQEWAIREQTLVQIADAFPQMTALQFRMSLRRLVEQAESGKQSIQNPNAWIKAAFKKNDGPLMTEREIEARLDRQESSRSQEQSMTPQMEEESHDLAVLRRYMAASAEDRASIDEMAEKKAAPMLAMLSTEKHAGILEQAKIECTQEFFEV